MRAPPDFREELHPEEIIRRPSRHPWLATVAFVVCAVAIFTLLRALAPFGGDERTTADQPGALQRGASPIAQRPGANDERGTPRGDR